MTTTTRALGGVLLAATLLLGGCGSSEAVVESEAMADAVCKCADLDCATKAASQGVEKLSKMKEPSADDKKKIEAAGQRAADCIKKLAPAEAPAPAPAPAPAEGAK